MAKKSCLCSDCKKRYSCFTNVRAFSDPLIQAYFEAQITLNDGNTKVAAGKVAEKLYDQMDHYNFWEKRGTDGSIAMNINNIRQIIEAAERKNRS
jgi:hypothetical protein